MTLSIVDVEAVRLIGRVHTQRFIAQNNEFD
jgi:hypothetical protein